MASAPRCAGKRNHQSEGTPHLRFNGGEKVVGLNLVASNRLRDPASGVWPLWGKTVLQPRDVAEAETHFTRIEPQLGGSLNPRPLRIIGTHLSARVALVFACFALET